MQICAGMGRNKLSETKLQIAARVAPRVKMAIELVAENERRSESQAIELLLEESPKIKAQLQKSGKK